MYVYNAYRKPAEQGYTQVYNDERPGETPTLDSGSIFPVNRHFLRISSNAVFP